MLSNAEAVCTFTRAGYDQHAKRFLDSWRWMPIHCYEEPLLLCRTESWIHEYDLEQESPELVQFKKDFGKANGRHGRNTYSYLFDAVKWSHRIFALAAQARRSKAELLVNIDSDIVVFDTPPDGFLEQLLGDADIAYMPRGKMYSECSFVIYRLSEPVHQFISDQENAYVRGTVFGLRAGWTDCHVFDVLVQIYTQRGVKFRNINEGIPDCMHPFVNGPLGKYMDHMKGARKNEGRSRQSDLVIRRSEEYWNQAS